MIEWQIARSVKFGNFLIFGVLINWISSVFRLKDLVGRQWKNYWLISVAIVMTVMGQSLKSRLDNDYVLYNDIGKVKKLEILGSRSQKIVWARRDRRKIQATMFMRYRWPFLLKSFYYINTVPLIWFTKLSVKNMENPKHPKLNQPRFSSQNSPKFHRSIIQLVFCVSI